jgi:hypothetical protein
VLVFRAAVVFIVFLVVALVVALADDRLRGEGLDIRLPMRPAWVNPEATVSRTNPPASVAAFLPSLNAFLALSIAVFARICASEEVFRATMAPITVVPCNYQACS